MSDTGMRHEYRAVYAHPTARVPGMYGPWRDSIDEAVHDRDVVGGVGIDRPRCTWPDERQERSSSADGE